jgi:hypothetical protein
VKLHLLSLATLTLACGPAAAADGFDGIACGSDIATVLKGRHLSDGPIENTESAHKDLGLKDLGANELDWGSETWWKICGTAYVAISDRHQIIHDVLKIPSKPGATLAFEGSCKGGPKGKEVIAIVEDKHGATDLPAQAAWKIDDAAKRFVPVPVEGLLCPRGDGIVDSWK